MTPSTVARVVPANALERAQIERWSAIQRSVPALASPFFCPEFTQIIGAVRDDTEVALLEADGAPVGFFPFQRRSFGRGFPVGLNLSDYHGIIAPEGSTTDVAQLLRACGLKTWEFDHLPASQTPFARFSGSERSSVVMDLSSGFEAYAQARRETGSRRIEDLRYKERKLARAYGPLSYVQHTADRALFELLLGWKERQYVQTGAVNILRRGWTREVLRLVHETQSEAFSGVLSVLRAGETVVALHLGMRSATVLHSWFPAYDPGYSKYSPRQILHLMMAEDMAALGIRAIDLGPGEFEHKLTLRSFGTPLMVGMAAVPSLAAQAVRTRRTAKAVIRRSALAPRVRSLARALSGLARR
jgi:CelD/BcsL family acetyltransferase involved in cellulose biosynthesis